MDAKKEPRIPGKPTRIRYSFHSILTGSDLARRRLPFMAAESTKSGPVIWLTACGHGDEVGGIVIIQEIFKRVRRTGLVKGSLFAFPLMNPLGFEAGSRNITASQEDLNRSFPGNKSGSLGQRIADRIFTAILKTKPTLALDLHNDWMKSIPYAVLDPPPGPQHAAAYAQAQDMAVVTGFPVIRDSDELTAALSYCLLQRDIPALTLEMGESYVVNEGNTECGVRSIWNILVRLGMAEPWGETFCYPLPESYQGKILRYSDKPLSSTSGIIRFLAKPGDLVKRGQTIARVYNAFGKLVESISAPDEALVLAHPDSSMVFPGMTVMAFGAHAPETPPATTETTPPTSP